MTTKRRIEIGAAVIALLLASPALADTYDPARPNLTTDYGMSVAIGGGVMGFVDGDARNLANTGGAWNARLVVGTRKQVAFEGAYTGSAQPIDNLIGLDDSAILIGTGFEGAVRLNAVEEGVAQPYIRVGVGFRRYDVTNTDLNTSSVEDSDNLFEIPMSAGIAYRYAGAIVDIRATITPTLGDDMLNSTIPDDQSVTFTTVGGNITLGWEF